MITNCWFYLKKEINKKSYCPNGGFNFAYAITVEEEIILYK